MIQKYDFKIRSANDSWEAPSVVKLNKRVDVRNQNTKFKRVNVYRRDQYKCQYCGSEFQYQQLTFDHVKPKSQGGKTTWNNIVTCCETCNFNKGDRTPKEAGMELLSKPQKPGYMPFTLDHHEDEIYSDDWKRYLWD